MLISYANVVAASQVCRAFNGHSAHVVGERQLLEISNRKQTVSSRPGRGVELIELAIPAL
jgi:hypothetical protein